jgi:WD40 repeat protein
MEDNQRAGLQGDEDKISSRTRSNILIHNLPTIPASLIVEHILPMLSDRKSFNNLRSASTEIHSTSKELIENGKITAPWPLKKLEVLFQVMAVAFSPEGGLLAFAGQNLNLVICDGRDSQFSGPQYNAQMEGFITCLDFSPDGTFLASANHDGIHLWRLADWSCTILENQGGIRSLAFSPDGLTLAAGSGVDGFVRLWRVNDGRCIREILDGRLGRNHSVAFSPDGGTLAIGAEEGACFLRVLPEGNDRGGPATCSMITGHVRVAFAVAFSPDGHTLATAGIEFVRLWSVEDQSFKAVLHHPTLVFSICFSPNGKILACGESVGTVRLWSVEGGDRSCSCLVTLSGHHSGHVFSLAFSPDGQTLASAGGRDESVRLWNPNEHDRRNKPGNWETLIRLWNSPA